MFRSINNADVWYIGIVIASGFIVFYSLTDAVSFLGRLMMTAMCQFSIGVALRRAEKDLNHESEPIKPWRQPRRSNNPTAQVRCPTCGAEPGYMQPNSVGAARGENVRGEADSAHAAIGNSCTSLYLKKMKN